MTPLEILYHHKSQIRHTMEKLHLGWFAKTSMYSLDAVQQRLHSLVFDEMYSTLVHISHGVMSQVFLCYINIFMEVFTMEGLY